ncbi:hypothetical protein TVAG_088890 [Trichomonas vaginalis G3]|uniref:Uncharacterized protein n=1 Tax=Trichomonas vaginalis (strain ATCC PRA-98 / G3) TaxID=412133 RepID=A2EB33_TRIV3|nr:hypothetical protein TVAGG3_0397580 [Trichomonas vaginalis G3]EAY10173.1 hypothetical protein TVAG_088890 [Trichomonas vaginalis G3]KAI5534447.1 hypothetical protein TVAGG3_0397580 [Trichomonas vaginalis G3]|eukprot:XP_001322396.1 hypothetical protein [Trichomonas vaginalis G3]
MFDSISQPDMNGVISTLDDKDLYKQVISKCSKVSAAGLDIITYSIIKAHPDKFAEIIAMISQKMLELGKFPLLWCKARSNLIYKGGDLGHTGS